jgi:hypothetical protein
MIQPMAGPQKTGFGVVVPVKQGAKPMVVKPAQPVVEVKKVNVMDDLLDLGSAPAPIIQNNPLDDLLGGTSTAPVKQTES